MRFFVSKRIPKVDRLLLVESGARGIAERALPVLRRTLGDELEIDLVTCYPGLPEGWTESTCVYRVSEYRGLSGRRRLYREVRERGTAVCGIICSGDPIMTKWKWALALHLPTKVMIINENADYFWLDRGHIRSLLRLGADRTGLSGSGIARTVARLGILPFSLLFLLLYAGAVHTRRALRLALVRRGAD